MKWKVALNAEEAALLITDLSEYSSLVEAKEFVDANAEFNPHNEVYNNYIDLKASFDEAVSLKEALWDEIHHAWRKQKLGEGRGSILALDSWSYDDECSESLSKKGCKVTKKSLAAWVYEMDGLEKAKMIYPNFDPNNLSVVADKPLQAKTENMYLATIQALSVALVGTSTGQYYTYAKQILDDLAEKGIDAPLSQKTLAAYLKKADEP